VRLLRTLGRHAGSLYVCLLASSFFALGVLLSHLTD
jgi:hypothetical protein